MTGFDCYRTYLAFKNHFTKDNFDYFKYGGKTNATTTSFNKRKDKYFFEKMSRQKKDEDIVDYFTAIFSQCDDPQKMWIGEIIDCLLYTSPSPRDLRASRMPSSA